MVPTGGISITGPMIEIYKEHGLCPVGNETLVMTFSRTMMCPVARYKKDQADPYVEDGKVCRNVDTIRMLLYQFRQESISS